MDAIEQLQQDVRQGRIGVERLIDLNVTLQRQLQAALQELTSARQRIEELEKKAGGSGTTKFDEPFSMRAEEKRQQARHKKKKHRPERKGRRGRLTSAAKVKLPNARSRYFPTACPSTIVNSRILGPCGDWK